MTKTGAFFAAFALPAALGCSDSAGGPDYARLGVRSTDQSGLVTATGCTTLPVLLGSRVLTRYDMGGRFDVVVDADFERARVRLEGVPNPESFARDLSAGSLRAGFAEQLNVVTASGSVILDLTSECLP